MDFCFMLNLRLLYCAKMPAYKSGPVASNTRIIQTKKTGKKIAERLIDRKPSKGKRSITRRRQPTSNANTHEVLRIFPRVIWKDRLMASMAFKSSNNNYIISGSSRSCKNS